MREGKKEGSQKQGIEQEIEVGREGGSEISALLGQMPSYFYFSFYWMRQIHACSGEGLEFVGFLTHADAANVKEEHAGITTGGGGGGGGGGHGVYVCGGG